MGNNRRFLPAELIEEILLNLPYKSVFRFSSVSKSWNSMIWEPVFSKKYDMINQSSDFLLLSGRKADWTCPISPISWDKPTSSVDEIDLVSPFVGEQPRLMATCDELWLAADNGNNSLFLWIPSTGTRRRIPNPPKQGEGDGVTFGLGYDSIGDDYKIVKISRCGGVELYSLRSDSWRDVEIPDINSAAYNIDTASRGGCVFVCGRLHWLNRNRDKFISLDFSLEKFMELEMPLPARSRFIYVSVLRGMLCVSYTLNSSTCDGCVVWVMEDYGEKSWTKKITKYGHSPFTYQWIVPLYYYVNGEFLLGVIADGRDGYRLYAYKDDKTRPRELIRSSPRGTILHALLYTTMPLSRLRLFSNL